MDGQHRHGNFGATSGIAEMLLQSYAGYIELLPALPCQWPQGWVEGLCARGGFEVDIAWEVGRVERGEIRSRCGNRCAIRSAVPLAVVCEGESVALRSVAEEIVEFETRAGARYAIAPAADAE